MDEIMKLIVQYFACNNVAPPEVTPEDIEREKSYLVDIPETPDNVFVFRDSGGRHASLVPKNVTVKRIQVIVRNTSQKEAHSLIDKLYKFILQVNGEDETFIHELNSNHWMIMDCRRGPSKMDIDEKGRHLWQLSFALTSNLY